MGAFAAFYERYHGIIGTESRGKELLDLHNDDTDPPNELSVVRATEACREAHAIPHRYLCISTYIANSVLVYDTTTDEVFDMDFEGSDELLRQGRLTADWPTFRDFLTYYFGLDGSDDDWTLQPR